MKKNSSFSDTFYFFFSSVRLFVYIQIKYFFGGVCNSVVISFLFRLIYVCISFQFPHVVLSVNAKFVFTLTSFLCDLRNSIPVKIKETFILKKELLTHNSFIFYHHLHWPVNDSDRVTNDRWIDLLERVQKHETKLFNFKLWVNISIAIF